MCVEIWVILLGFLPRLLNRPRKGSLKMATKSVAKAKQDWQVEMDAAAELFAVDWAKMPVKTRDEVAAVIRKHFGAAGYKRICRIILGK